MGGSVIVTAGRGLAHLLEERLFIQPAAHTPVEEATGVLPL